MRPQLRTSTEQRRRSSVALNAETAASLQEMSARRGSNISVGGGGQFLSVPGHSSIRRSSLSTSTSALLGMAEGTRKRGSFTSAVSSGSLLCVPQDCEPRRKSLPSYMDGKNRSVSDGFLDRRRSSVRPDDVYRQINEAGTRKMKIFGLVMVCFLALVLALSFLKLLHG
ncbi:hypothetical protein ACOMHN_001112 [Nucella lapillus]